MPNRVAGQDFSSTAATEGLAVELARGQATAMCSTGWGRKCPLCLSLKRRLLHLGTVTEEDIASTWGPTLLANAIGP
jgi:hypothetical protein